MLIRTVFLALIGAALLGPMSGDAAAQLAGSRGGVTPSGNAFPTEPTMLSPETAGKFITVDATVELSVPPDEIRIVMAITAEGESASDCRRQIASKIEAVRLGWLELEVAEDDIVEDFIAVLPRYDFSIEVQQNTEVAVEKKVGYLMQTNLHVRVENDQRAAAVIDIAFDHDVTDIIAFDYSHRDLDALKKQARREAVAAARDKASLMFDGLFDERPRVINIQESTRVVPPAAMYESFQNSDDGSFRNSYSTRRDLPQILAFRPKNTYYRGLNVETDHSPRELALRPQISIVSTVRLYFESPAAQQAGSVPAAENQHD